MHCHCCQLVSSQTVYLMRLLDILLAARSEAEVRARQGWLYCHTGMGSSSLAYGDTRVAESVARRSGQQSGD